MNTNELKQVLEQAIKMGIETTGDLVEVIETNGWQTNNEIINGINEMFCSNWSLERFNQEKANKELEEAEAKTNEALELLKEIDEKFCDVLNKYTIADLGAKYYQTLDKASMAVYNAIASLKELVEDDGVENE